MKIKEIASQKYFKLYTHLEFLHIEKITKKNIILIEKHLNAKDLLEILEDNYVEFYLIISFKKNTNTDLVAFLMPYKKLKLILIEIKKN